MTVNEVFVLDDAVEDLNDGKNFYDQQEQGIGDYFWDCLISDIESIVIYGGIHVKKYGLFQMYSKRFPYAIYYEIINRNAYVVAVLPMKRDPSWIMKKIKERH